MTDNAADLDPELGSRAYDLDRAHVFHSWSAQGSLNPFVVAGAHGSEVWDYDGKKYLDFSSQLVNMNIGHTHPKVVAAIQAQAAELPSVAPAHANLARGEAAARILARAGSHFGKVFFTNGGADANENAIRMARLTTGRDKVLSTYRSYHGNTGAAVVATGDWRRVPNEYARGPRSLLRPVPLSHRVLGLDARGGERPRPAAPRARHRLGGRRRRSPRSCSKAFPAPPAC